MALNQACGQESFDKKISMLYKNTVPVISVEKMKEKLNGEDQPVILDTRSPEEYSVSHIQGARFVDYDNFTPEKVEDIPLDSEVIVYCSVGVRSERIGEKLQKMGFKNVKNLYGGVFNWKNNNQEVVNDNGTPTDSVHAYNRIWGVWLNKGIKVYD